MYRAKQEGGADGDHVAFYSQDMNQGMQERMRIETGLRNALGNGELLLHYQPKYAIQWQDHRRGSAGALAPPAARAGAAVEFIPLAEATGLVVQVGEWVLETACAQAQRGKMPGCRRSGWP
jgi:EAL domain-containing protein (putative c-di-GMP-specific phosphodiesterase class I)